MSQPAEFKRVSLIRGSERAGHWYLRGTSHRRVWGRAEARGSTFQMTISRVQVLWKASANKPDQMIQRSACAVTLSASICFKEPSPDLRMSRGWIHAKCFDVPGPCGSLGRREPAMFLLWGWRFKPPPSSPLQDYPKQNSPFSDHGLQNSGIALRRWDPFPGKISIASIFAGARPLLATFQASNSWLSFVERVGYGRLLPFQKWEVSSKGLALDSAVAPVIQSRFGGEPYDKNEALQIEQNPS